MAELGRPIDTRRLVSNLSMAEQQAVEIARALAFDARLIVMDEPTAPLGEQDAENLFGAIDRLKQRGVSVIFISHRLKEIFQIADRVTVMRDGRRVLTTDTGAIGHDELVRAMVGSELNRFAAPVSGQPAGSEEVLRVEGSAHIAVRRGEVVGLAGLAGAGRTELLEAIFGAGGRPQHIVVNGRPAVVRTPLDAIRNGIALVPDDRKGKGLVPGASLGTNIALAGGRGSVFIRGALERQAAGRFMRELHIRATGPDQPVSHLSGGNQQKAVLAKWLYAGADVFLLDEPTRGIDVRSKAEIYELIHALAARGAGVLLASSETEELLRVADRIVVMHRGRVAGELDRATASEERIMRLATGGGN
jgi:ribose transport system ATP-binding protein